MKVIKISLIVILVLLLTGFIMYVQNQRHNEYLEYMDKQAHSICETGDLRYLSHFQGFGSSWYVFCINEKIGGVEKVRFK